MKRLPAKLLLATAHMEIGNEEDVIIVRHGSAGMKCYSTLENAETMKLLWEVWLTMVESHGRKGNADA